MKIKTIITLLLISLVFSTKTTIVEAKKHSPTKKISVKGGGKFLLYYNKAIQGICTSGKDIYIQQAYKVNEFEEFEDYQEGDEENLVLISRCRYSKEYDAYIPKDHMLLKNVGHGQTIDCYKHKGKKYLLISCGRYRPWGNNFSWSTQIGRIRYKPNVFLKNNKIKRLTYLKYANPKLKAMSKTQVRVDGALSPDKKILLIWKTNGIKNEFTGYDFKTVNRLWDKAKGNELKIKGNKKLKKAIKFFTNKLKPRPASIQGLALSNKKSGKYRIYISSGNERIHKYGNTIYKYEIKGNKLKFKSRIKLLAPDIHSMYADYDEENDAQDINNLEDDEFDYEDEEVLTEIESLEIFKDKLRFILRDTEDFDQQILSAIPIGVF